MLQVAALVIILVFVFFTWPFWLGLLFIFGPIIPAGIATFVLALVGMFAVECWQDWRYHKQGGQGSWRNGGLPGWPKQGLTKQELAKAREKLYGRKQPVPEPRVYKH